jgi:putative peptidoglycan lipid II flippase
MVKKLFGFVGKEINGLHQAAYLLAIFTIFAQLLSLVRDRLLAHHFGASAILDVYYASFRIPDLIFVTVSSLVAVSVLIPFLIKESDKGKENAQEFINNVFTVFMGVIVSVIVVAFFLTPWLLSILVPGIYHGVNQDLLIRMTRILLLSPLLLGISNLFSSIHL